MVLKSGIEFEGYKGVKGWWGFWVMRYSEKSSLLGEKEIARDCKVFVSKVVFARREEIARDCKVFVSKVVFARRKRDC